jgi:signal transduction histidine kinase/CheY-like chemotaxis protein
MNEFSPNVRDASEIGKSDPGEGSVGARQRIVPVRRAYNRWVGNQTLEDYALRFTAKSARQYSPSRISHTAIGAISFLALEAVGGAITLSYGTTNAVFAILIASVLLLLIGMPIAKYAIRHGVDIDLLTRGAGFGYIGSTITSLIYASFTFILFAIEASIMTGALELVFGIPLWLGYIISSLAVIPLVTHGVKMISRFQLVTQPVWIVLNILPFIFIAFSDWEKFDFWLSYAGQGQQSGELGTIAPFDLAMFGAASAVILALMAQIGEQVDFLRFLPPDHTPPTWRQRFARFLAGPGWVIVGAPKLLAGSFLVVLALSSGIPASQAADPAHMYVTAFGYMVPNHTMALVLTAAFVVVSQLKINVMNAYAGSLAWSNFFSRLTHSHPGRVVWLFFNVAIALLLMELGIYKLLEETLGVFSIISAAWLCSISADLFINKPLGLAPPGIEFKRAHLYDINPVGVGGMTITAALALAAHFGLFGDYAASLAIYMTPISAAIAVPAIAWATKGKYYLARKPRQQWKNLASITCSICEHPFEPEDMAWCPAYAAPICSLCCTLDSRCQDMCKPKARLKYQASEVMKAVLPEPAIRTLSSRLGRYGVTTTLAIGLIGLVLWGIAERAGAMLPDSAGAVGITVWLVFLVFAIFTGIVTWFFVLAHDSRVVAEEESSRQNALLLKEIAAHRKTDAALQYAKETAESANRAKSRYVVGLTHELRTPLNAVLGYAQLLERDESIPDTRRSAIRVIKRSADHLSGLIDGLLDISKIEAGRLQVFSNEIAIRDLLDQVVSMMRPQAEAKGLVFDVQIDERLPNYVRTDERRLRQILVNILSNAIKYTREGTVSFALAYRGQVATFSISDTGTGIPEADLPVIFEPFQRGSGQQAQLAPGLGLGLTITRLLTQTLGGEITVDSVEGQGTTFRVRLMLYGLSKPGTPISDRKILTYTGSRRTIVVVDDNEEHRELMREALSPLDFVVLTAISGPDCLALIEGARPDIFLIDISMPGMTGWELAAKLRAGGTTAPIVMLSANIGDGGIGAISGGDHTDTLAKPVNFRQLHDKLAALLGLDWVYATAVSGPPRRSEPALRSPGAGHIEELIRLGEIGFIRGIEAKLAELAKSDQNQHFAAVMTAHVKAFNIDAYLADLRTLEREDERP